MSDSRLIAAWLGRDHMYMVGKIAVSPSDWIDEWNPANDVMLWNGPDGLLQTIRDKGLLQLLTDHLIADCGITVEVEHDGSMWLPIERVPELVQAAIDAALLTAALVATITGLD